MKPNSSYLLFMMALHPIQTESDHQAALREIEELWGAADGSVDGERLGILAALVEAYEEQRWPSAPPLKKLS